MEPVSRYSQLAKPLTNQSRAPSTSNHFTNSAMSHQFQLSKTRSARKRLISGSEVASQYHTVYSSNQSNLHRYQCQDTRRTGVYRQCATDRSEPVTIRQAQVRTEKMRDECQARSTTTTQTDGHPRTPTMAICSRPSSGSLPRRNTITLNTTIPSMRTIPNRSPHPWHRMVLHHPWWAPPAA